MSYQMYDPEMSVEKPRLFEDGFAVRAAKYVGLTIACGIIDWGVIHVVDTFNDTPDIWPTQYEVNLAAGGAFLLGVYQSCRAFRQARTAAQADTVPSNI